MSALVNLTAISPFTAAVSNIPTIPIIESPFAGFRSSFHADAAAPPIQLRHHRQKMVGRRRAQKENNRKHHHQQHDRKQREEEEEREKKRRSLNIPEYGKAKELRLFNTRQNTFVQIQSDGAVRTGPQSNSIHSIFEVLFWCHLAPQLFKPCSSSPSSFSAILLRFKASNRYLCMSHSGRIYTQIPGESLKNVEDCIFQHEFLSNQYDVYYSWRYPNGTWPCTSPPDTTAKTPNRRTCLNRWYLGVDKKGKLVSVKTPNTKVRRNTFFIQRWIHDQAGQGRPEYPNPLAGSTPSPVEGGIFKIHSTRSRSSVFDILSHRRHSTRTHVTAAEATSSRRDCLNLLKNCDRDERSKESTATGAQRRTASGAVAERRLITLRKRREVLWMHSNDAP